MAPLLFSNCALCDSIMSEELFAPLFLSIKENTMHIIVGTTNRAKVTAVEEILREYPHLAVARISGISTISGVPDQPLSLSETILGARNRAANVFADCDYSIGIESGLMHVPESKSGYMDVCVCVIYDGHEYHLGLSSVWEFPDIETTRMIVEEGFDMSQAIRRAGMTDDIEIGSSQGAIGILTKGRLDRKNYTKQALRTALIHLEQFDH
jgi:inosine/xanthosine triphosphatase